MKHGAISLTKHVAMSENVYNNKLSISEMISERRCKTFLLAIKAAHFSAVHKNAGYHEIHNKFLNE